MAVPSLKTASLDHSYQSNTSDTTYSYNVEATSIPKDDINAKLERGEYSSVKFAREEAHPDIARVKLSLHNNSKRLIEWVLKGINENIQAIPKTSGLVKAYDSEECTLIWHRPKDYNSWHEIPPLKMMLEIKLISSETGKIIAIATNKFQATIDPNTVCKAEKPPIHKIVLNSGPATMILRKEKPKRKSDTNLKMKTKMESKDFLDDSQRIYSILFLSLCLLTALLLKILEE